MIQLRTATILIIGVLLIGCKPSNPNFQAEVSDAQLFHNTVQKLTDIIVNDIFSPPVASRIYVYPSVAAYECMVNDQPAYKSLSGQLSEFKNVPKPEANKEYAFPIAALHAYSQVGKALIFSEDKMVKHQAVLAEQFKAMNVPQDVYDRSMAFGQEMADSILAWADHDMYKQTRTFPKYSVVDDNEKWRPTPPDYMDGIEPHWREIRTLVLDSAQQFPPLPPTTFSLDPKSKFMAEVREVYDVVKTAGEEEIAIAQFWDCNPYVSHHKGHVMFATKKITPGGHWMGISKIASQKTNANFMKSVETYTRVAISLFDGFISCWDEKYRSSLLRPETVINQNIDEDWLPLLQTPPFPEHTSGHSVISTAAAVALTDLYGDNFSFVDSTEVAYGLPARTFKSFDDACMEAAVSRLYGGIHYRPAIDYGVTQGRKVGELIVKRIVTSK